MGNGGPRVSPFSDKASAPVYGTAHSIVLTRLEWLLSLPGWSQTVSCHLYLTPSALSLKISGLMHSQSTPSKAGLALDAVKGKGASWPILEYPWELLCFLSLHFLFSPGPEHSWC